MATPSSTQATSTTPTTASPTVTPTVRQTRTAPVLPKAADGNNLKACSDADLKVTTVAIQGRTGILRLRPA
jgi:hypothetical protein